MSNQTSGGYFSPWLKAQRLKRAAAFVRGRVLDYGCGSGDLLEFCQPAFYVGYDIDENALNLARKRHPQRIFTSDFACLQRAGEKFDVIVMAAVIEHIEKPSEVLAELRRFLALQGRFILTTPHPNWRWAHDFGAQLGLFSKEASEEHKSFLDRQKILALGQALELELVHAELFLFGANQIFVLDAK